MAETNRRRYLISAMQRNSGNLMGKTSSYRQALLESLTDPEEAAAYLDAAMEDSQEAFLKASKNILQSRHFSMVQMANNAGVQRETLYRSLSENGNPTLKTLRAVLGTLGLRLSILPLANEQAAIDSQDSQGKDKAPTKEEPIRKFAKKLPQEDSNVSRYLRTDSYDAHQGDRNQLWQAEEREEFLSPVGAA